MWIVFLNMLFALFILSIKTGIILGTSCASRKNMALISFSFACILYAGSVFLTHYTKIIAGFIDQYTFIGSMLLSVFLIYLGLHVDAGESGQIKHKILAYLPCPFCLLAMAISVMLTKVQLKRNDQLLEIGVAILFFVFIFLIATGMKWVIYRFKVNPMNIFNGILLFLGILTLLLGLFIPNYVNAAKMCFSPIKVDSLKILGIVFSGLLGVISMGFIHYKIQN
ncbi:DUF2162 family putative transporter [Marinisporobacter balticus]|uniref:Putative transporter n=1 Tax=Marinisporobacter balticus TaxID=2018667 RepID=A0A4V2SBZ8_9FIRM|nr:DUF2162 family putative transporter [Marinisporobacter balticus]TCO76930.1 putative transporter [Marinisporobacter balticus]